MQIAEQKKDLRKHFRGVVSSISSDMLQKKSSVIISHLKCNSHFIEANHILIYANTPAEPNTFDILEKIQSFEKHFYLPFVREHAIGFIENLNKTKRSELGILEPIKALPIESFKLIDLIIIPGLAFDSEGYRLGHGKGWYDHVLMNFVEVYKIGLCFNEQRIDSLPHDKFDVKVDQVISD